MRRRSVLVLVIMAFLLMSLPAFAQSADDIVTITIINTADEHGWLQPFTPPGSDVIQGGAANIYSWWVQNEDYDPDEDLLLSGGDNWTGPSISTWFEGAPMVEAFNLMGYDASAIGNHEFDFGRDVMAQRFDEANYPYLAANIRDSETNALVDFARPYVILESQGVKVGVIGLSTLDTPTTTNPKNIDDLIFTDYLPALREFVPQMRTEGAQIVIALTHVCEEELVSLASGTEQLFDALFAGHCNELTIGRVTEESILGGGSSWRSYARLNITYNKTTHTIVNQDRAAIQVEYRTDEDNPVEPNAEIAALVDDWQAKTDVELAREIGYTESGLERGSDAMGNWVMDAWLWAYPQADVAVSNWGGFRQALDAGPITLDDVVSILPFDNTLIVVEITGEQLAENLRCCQGAVAGISYARRGRNTEITFLDGREFDPQATYRVLINDFMYNGGDDYLFGDQDPDGYDTGIHWRQPVIDYTASLNTTLDNPLENYVSFTARQR